MIWRALFTKLIRTVIFLLSLKTLQFPHKVQSHPNKIWNYALRKFFHPQGMPVDIEVITSRSFVKVMTS